jgi:hypothetical protein
MRNIDLNCTSPEKAKTSPTKPSQLSWGVFIRWELAAVLATAPLLTALSFQFGLLCFDPKLR